MSQKTKDKIKVDKYTAGGIGTRIMVQGQPRAKIMRPSQKRNQSKKELGMWCKSEAGARP
jgi:hypothetical protein